MTTIVPNFMLGKTFEDKVPLKDQLDIIETYRQSGLSQMGFCREFGVPYSRFKNWIRTPRKRKSRPTTASDFVPVVLEKTDSPIIRSAGGGDFGAFRVVFSGRYGDTSLAIPPNFDEGTLHRLMTALGASHV
jgi:hypothetical protein